MMYQFLGNHRSDLVRRCKDKVAARPQRAATDAQLANGVPMFLEQLIRTLEAEDAGCQDASVEISGASRGRWSGAVRSWSDRDRPWRQPSVTGVHRRPSGA